jgi:hypothetical protein
LSKIHGVIYVKFQRQWLTDLGKELDEVTIFGSISLQSSVRACFWGFISEVVSFYFVWQKTAPKAGGEALPNGTYIVESARAPKLRLLCSTVYF